MFDQWAKFCHQKKLKAVLEAQYDSLYRVAYGWSQSESVAADLVQDTMVKALERSDQLYTFDKVDRWLFKIMHHQFLDHLRQHKNWVEIEQLDREIEMYSGCLEQLYIQNQVCEDVHQAIGCLSIEYRQVILLVDLEGYSYQEVSQILKVPLGTVMSRVSRARQRIRLLLEKKQSGSESSNLVEFKTNEV